MKKARVYLNIEGCVEIFQVTEEAKSVQASGQYEQSVGVQELPSHFCVQQAQKCAEERDGQRAGKWAGWAALIQRWNATLKWFTSPTESRRKVKTSTV